MWVSGKCEGEHPIKNGWNNKLWCWKYIQYIFCN